MEFLGLLKDIIDIVVLADKVTRHKNGSKTENCAESLEEIDGSQD